MTTPETTPAETDAALQEFGAEFPTVAQLRAAWKAAEAAALDAQGNPAAYRAAVVAETAAWDRLQAARRAR